MWFLNGSFTLAIPLCPIHGSLEYKIPLVRTMNAAGARAVVAPTASVPARWPQRQTSEHPL